MKSAATTISGSVARWRKPFGRLASAGAAGCELLPDIKKPYKRISRKGAGSAKEER
jgi:hypothetical protein